MAAIGGSIQSVTLNGREFPVDEARGVIPVHPNCRCVWVPVVD